MTEKLFYTDQYQTECKATVTKLEGSKVQLDRTVFFAFAGGQASDSGTIGGINVREAIANNGEITYTLESAPNFKEKDEVEVVIDAEKRLKLMKLHSAIHVVDFLFMGKYRNAKRTGSNIDETKGRLDYEYPENINPLLPGLEKQANEMLSQNLEIKRWKDEDNPEIMQWQIADIKDAKQACGGTHVRNTGEIGRIKLKRKNTGKGKERIEVYLEAAANSP